MTATATDVQVKIDAAVTALKKTTATYPYMVKTYGTDWTKWPVTSNWYVAFTQLAGARAEVGQLGAATVTGSPKAAFVFKEN